MSEELERSLSRFRMYELSLPMTDSLEHALSHVYSETIVFCEHTVALFGGRLNVSRIRNTWPRFSPDLSAAIANIHKYSRMADEAAHMIRLSRETHTADTVQAISDLQKPRVVDVILPCYMIPHGLNKKLYGRSTEINTLRRILNPEGSDSLQAIAIYGLGGVGKTQLALHYANTFMRLYDVVAWISAETQIKLTQSLSDLTFRLGLHQEKEDKNAYNSIHKVRDWLNVSGKTFLLVFDNVENIELLDQIWPAGDRGSLILTTRSLNVASKRTMNVMKLKCFEGEDMYEMIYSLSDYRPMNEKDKAAAEEV
ncbi:hypothetical protein Plec18167_002063 [Paecilomyces lecythidis]|uniref:NB-ARC domain-containing protein n=1 Tax=Paecilomyces lecythidis TaxID=3004212 RepID=A0ABR3Y9J9_9EURO